MGSATQSTVMTCIPPEGMEPNPGYTVKMPCVKRAYKKGRGAGGVEAEGVTELRDGVERDPWGLSPQALSESQLSPGDREGLESLQGWAPSMLLSMHIPSDQLRLSGS